MKKELPLTTIQRSYLLGRELKDNFGGVATQFYIETLYDFIDVGKLEYAINT